MRIVSRLLMVMILPLLLLNLSPFVAEGQSGYEVLFLKTRIAIEKQTWDTEIHIRTGQYETGNPFTFRFPIQLSNISTTIDGVPSPNRLIRTEEVSELSITPIKEIGEDTLIVLTIHGIVQIDETSTDERTSLFRYQIGLNYAVQNVSVSIVLPEHTSITSDSDILNVFPSVFEMETNGKNVIITWNDLSLSEDTVETVIVEYRYPENYQIIQRPERSHFFIGLMVGMSTTILITALIIVGRRWFLTKDGKEQQNPLQGETGVRIHTVIRPVVLKPHQKTILDVLKQGDGGITQNDLIKIIGLSKSRVSQYLKELEEQGIIIREKAGRQNMVFLNFDIEVESGQISDNNLSTSSK